MAQMEKVLLVLLIIMQELILLMLQQKEPLVLEAQLLKKSMQIINIYGIMKLLIIQPEIQLKLMYILLELMEMLEFIQLQLQKNI